MTSAPVEVRMPKVVNRQVRALLLLLAIIFTICLLGMVGCRKSITATHTPTDEFDAQVMSKWGKPMADLPKAQLVLISAHNEAIRKEFARAFTMHYAMEYGKNVSIEWRDVGGGSGAILKYLTNVYANASTSGVDVMFGTGEYPAQYMAQQKLLEPLKFSPDVWENIPSKFSGMPMYDPDHMWCGTVLSGFGFIYNIDLINRLKLQAPQTWDDLGKPEWFNLIILADPTQSGTAAAAYEMVVQSAPSWPQGWAKLLAIISNTKKFTDSSGTAADAPVSGESVIATCIDFFGSERVAKAPDKLAYVNPKGQTGFTPDPVAIPKNPPNPEEAQRFAEFLLSPEGQALWALPMGAKGGPVWHFLGRTPIRMDVYQKYAGQFPASLSNPYEKGTSMDIDAKMRVVRYAVLAQLVRAAAIENRDLLHNARRKLIETKFEPARLSEFNQLPQDVDTPEKIYSIAEALKDPVRAEKIVTGWTAFFRARFENVAR
jgi:ABC-type Fe3+ transport system substrate-binding protein